MLSRRNILGGTIATGIAAIFGNRRLIDGVMQSSEEEHTSDITMWQVLGVLGPDALGPDKCLPGKAWVSLRRV